MGKRDSIQTETHLIMTDTTKRLIGAEQATLQALKDVAATDMAVAQGKFEIAANVLHDIGNAIVGFGSHLTRIRGSLEREDPKCLTNLAGFLTDQQAAIAAAIGEAKAGAVISMLNSIIESQRTQRDEIQKSMIEQLHIISHIQEMLRIERQYVAGQENEKKPANLRGILNDCLSMLSASIEKRGITVSLNIVPEVPVIYGDRTRLMQVIMNILKNSIEAIGIDNEAKAIAISLHTEGNCLVLEVRDTGGGFDEATGSRLFARGFTTKSSGSGLGLHNCRTIVESYAGTISISSAGPGKGSKTMIKFKM